jgi:hypothetical protein
MQMTPKHELGAVKHQPMAPVHKKGVALVAATGRFQIARRPAAMRRCAADHGALAPYAGNSTADAADRAAMGRDRGL